jgi:hypothetical protein
VTRRDDWWQQCSRCGEMTAPCDRKARACRSCKRDPRPANERRADAVWTAGLGVALLIGWPAGVVAIAALTLADAIAREP